MPRYFTRARRPKAEGWEADDVWSTDAPPHIPTVSDHEATDTGLLDANGDTIMRAPNPMGFLWEYEK